VSARVLLSIVESPLHPNFTELYEQLGYRELRVDSQRKAIGTLKHTRPDYVVAEFFYGYGNNYAGINISNLDVFLHSLQKYAPEARVIVLVDKGERVHVDKLATLFDVHGILTLPVTEADIAPMLAPPRPDRA
jgi:hypothetical protein